MVNTSKTEHKNLLRAPSGTLKTPKSSKTVLVSPSALSRSFRSPKWINNIDWKFEAVGSPRTVGGGKSKHIRNSNQFSHMSDLKVPPSGFQYQKISDRLETKTSNRHMIPLGMSRRNRTAMVSPARERK